MRVHILTFAALFAVEANALVLGDLEVESHVGEPLKAMLVVSNDPAEDPTRVEYSIGEASDYERLGLERLPVVNDIEVGDPELTGGRWLLPLATRQSVAELVLDVVIVARRPGAIESRHYPVLLDFPAAVAMPEAAPEPEPAPVRSVRSGPAPTASPTGVQNARGPRPGGRTLVVERGDTLYAIAQRVGKGAPLDQVADAIFQLNPDAFINGNRNRLLAGAELALPEDYGIVEASEPATADAARQVRPQPAAPVVPPRKAAESDRVRLRAPPTPDEIVDTLASWMEADEALLAGSRETVQRDLAFARTEIETYKRRNENLRDRIATLEKRVADMRRLLELRAAVDGNADAEDAEPTASAADDQTADAADELAVNAASVEPEPQPDDPTLDLSGAEPAVDPDDRKQWRWIIAGGAGTALAALIWLVARARSQRDASGAQEQFDAYLPDDLR